MLRVLLALVLASSAVQAQQAFTFAQPSDCVYAACGVSGPCYLDPGEVSAPEALELLADHAPQYLLRDLTDRIAASGDSAFVGALLSIADDQAGIEGNLDYAIDRQDRAFYVLRAASGLGAPREVFVSRALDLDRPVVAAAAIRTLALDPDEAELDSLQAAAGAVDLAQSPAHALASSALTHYTASLFARQRYETLRSVNGRLNYLLWGPREGWRVHAFRDLHEEDSRRVDLAILSYQVGTSGNGGPPAPSRNLTCEQTEVEAYARERQALYLLLEAPPSLVPPFRAAEEGS